MYVTDKCTNCRINEKSACKSHYNLLIATNFRYNLKQLKVFKGEKFTYYIKNWQQRTVGEFYV